MAWVVVIGDIGGHPDQLRAALTSIGAHGPRLDLPPDVVVLGSEACPDPDRGRAFTGIDPKLGRSGAVAWRPLVLTDAEVLVGSGRQPAGR